MCIRDRVHFETAEMRYKEASISFDTGLGDMPAMSSAHEAMVQSLSLIHI